MLKVQNYKDIVVGHGSCSLLGTRLKVNLYLVDGLLIDTGPFRLRKDSIPFFKEHKIEQVVLTHVHEDHSGMAYWLQKHEKVPIYLDANAIKEAEERGRYRLYRRLIWNKRKPF
ncbi:MAG: MBL fold metallo-hydrolase, partial [Desulfitobacterium sp.]|nr:MBL fold metallo-hydrolase [Desulfitobacterium sp.]